MAEVENRLNDPTNVVWTEEELRSFVDFSIKSLYPSFFQLKVATTVATDGPLQAMPVNCSHLHNVGIKRASSTRVRPQRGWEEGDGYTYIPKTGISGDTIVWSWTEGWDAPASDTEPLDIPLNAEEVVVLRAQIRALEKLLTDRVSQDRYFSLNVRQGASETDILDTIDGMRAAVSDLLAKAIVKPERKDQ
jgi:hypothetical protein